MLVSSLPHFVIECLYVCVHVNNPSLTVSNAISLTVTTKTAPVGSNPFEDDEDEEEEIAEEQQTTVNHISVNKEETKTLVNRRNHSIYLSLSVFGLWIAVHTSTPDITLS